MSEEFPIDERRVAAISAVDDMAVLLQRSDLPESRPSWWTTVISVCTSGMSGVDVGEEDAERWAELLVRALDKAECQGGLGVEDTLHRRMMACAVAIQNFGVQKGNEVRDPHLVASRFIEEFGRSPEIVVNRLREAISVPRGVQIDESYYVRIKWISTFRQTIEALARVAEFLEDETQRQIIDDWCNALDSIPDRRIYPD
ncbi:hypothetical protein [Actinomadura sp. B10D3]|uniref:hypothetical protein n=1 Tax=Actinomadura sp. B10D3 TaxID=3153557 RepID=UPI00325D6D60